MASVIYRCMLCEFKTPYGSHLAAHVCLAMIYYRQIIFLPIFFTLESILFLYWCTNLLIGTSKSIWYKDEPKRFRDQKLFCIPSTLCMFLMKICYKLDLVFIVGYKAT